MKSILKYSGFTLIEIMLALIIAAILVTIAVPSYLHYMRTTYRTNAMQVLETLHLDEEKYRYSNPSYSSALPLPSADHYTISIVSGSATATSYTLRATANGSQASDSENGQSCATLTLAVSNGNVTKTPQVCWEN